VIGYSPCFLSSYTIFLLQNVAFLSFLLFTTLQLFFALIARSDSMMADCGTSRIVLLSLHNVIFRSEYWLFAFMYQLDLNVFLTLFGYRLSTTAAMYVDVVTYLFNFLAERLKHNHDSNISARELRLRRLYLELIPPSISVVTLLIVTVLALQQAYALLFASHDDDAQGPDLSIMVAFSALNLVLDGLNVSCFARVDQTAGFYHNSSQHSVDQATVATETTPLVESSSLTLPPLDINMGSYDDDGGGADNSDDEKDSQDSTEIPGGINLNMCSAFTVRLLHAGIQPFSTLQQQSFSFLSHLSVL
jgi:hypothetical protein